MSNVQFHSDLDRLIEILPPKITKYVNADKLFDVIELVLDLGRQAEIRHSDGSIEYIGDERGRVKEMRLQKMQLGEPDASGRRRPVPIEGAIETIKVDEVIVSVGVSPNPLIPHAFGGLEISKKGTIVVNEQTMRSSLPDVYAGGDIVRGGATVILAMGDGRRAAAAMDEALSRENR